MPGTVGRVPMPPAPVSGQPAATDLVLHHDWSRTPLGPWAGWDPSVRAAAELIVASPVPMALALGDDLLLLYNDGYAQLIGDKHPAALGRPAAEMFPEIWDLPGMGEVVEHTYRTGEPFLEKETTLPLLRHGSGVAEQAVFTRGFSAG